MQHHVLAGIAGLACTLLAAPALAQSAAESPRGAPASTAQNEAGRTSDDSRVIVVLGSGLPDTPATTAYSTITIPAELITSSASGRLEDVLRSVAGFQQFRRSDSRSSNPSAQGATLRALGGNATSRALILLDGVPQLDPFFGFIPFSAIPPERLGAIRVTRGGGSGAFGSGALAGTIDMTSADPSGIGALNASMLVNDRAETELSATMAPRVGKGFAIISGRWDRGRGFDTTPAHQQTPATVNAAFDSWSMSGRLVQPVADDVELQINGLAFRDARTLRFAGADSSSEGRDISLRLVSRGAWQVDAIAYGQWRNFTNIVISATQFVPVLNQKDTPSTGLGGKLEIRPPVDEAHTLRFGLDYRRNQGDLAEDAFSAMTRNLTQIRFAGGVTDDLGLYLENDWQTGPLTLTGGVRLDRYSITDGYFRAFAPNGDVVRDDRFADRSDWEFTWRSGALVRAHETLALRAAAYSSLRLPTLNELYRPFVVFPVTTQANAMLLPERLEGWELGLDYKPQPGLTFQITYFDNEVQDAIANVTIQQNLRQRRNVEAIEATGIEFASSIERGAFGFDATLALTDARVRDTGAAAALDGNRPQQVPRFSTSATARWRPAEGWLMLATLRHVSDQFEGDLEDDVLEAATTLDMFAQVPLRPGVSLIARAENLFDEMIVTRNQGGQIDLGAPRTLWLGLRMGL